MSRNCGHSSSLTRLQTDKICLSLFLEGVWHFEARLFAVGRVGRVWVDVLAVALVLLFGVRRAAGKVGRNKSFSIGIRVIV